MKDIVFATLIVLLAWTFKAAQWTGRFLNMQCKFLPVEFADTFGCSNWKEEKSYVSPFGMFLVGGMRGQFISALNI